jgi:hypothetical protein
MTLRGRLITLFPLLVLALGGVSAIEFIREPSLGRFAAVVFVWYLLPPLCFRLHDLICPLRPGREDLSDGSAYSPWWGSQQFQIAYSVIPQLEVLLRLIPGAYSAWLRLWGSRIGRGVIWTPVADVIDRSLLDIGNGVFFGHRVSLCSHTVLPKAGRQMLFVARIRIGDGAFISGACALGLGARVADGEFVPLDSILYFNRRLK